MSEVTYNQLSELFSRKEARDCPVYLVHGEPALVDQCVEQLVVYLLKGESRELCCQSLEGLMENIPEMLSQLNTYSIMTGPRLVVFKDAKLFENQSDQQRFIGQIVDALALDRLDRAARTFLSLCARLAIAIDKLDLPDVPVELQPLESEIGVAEIGRLLTHCRQQGWSVELGDANLDVLMRALERGFPPRHTLLITVYSKAPKTRKLFKAILTHGVIVDCSVPGGERRADKMVQESVLRQTLDEMLGAAQKKIGSQLIGTLIGLTGFDLPSFRNNVEKLISYTGSRTEIKAEDIHSLLQKTKIDPLYELTNAIADRDVARAAGCLDGLLKAEWHPLQIIAALANQARKLLVAKDFAAGPEGRCWSARVSYAQFQSQVMPVIQQNDAGLAQKMTSWISSSGRNSSEVARTVELKAPAELALAGNPRSAFPVFQTLLKSENFAASELVDMLQRISEADVRLKSTGQDPTQVLTALIFTICMPLSGRTPVPKADMKR